MKQNVGNVQLMQKMNRLKVLDYVRKHPNCSRPVIAKETGLSLASVTNMTSYLLEQGLLRESGREKVERVGRKSTYLRFAEEAYDLLCIFISEHHITLYTTNMVGKPKKKNRKSTRNLTPEAAADLLDSMVAEAMQENGNERILGIGVAISGLVLSDSRFVFSSKLRWKTVDIKKRLEEATCRPVFVDNISLLRAAWEFDVNQSDVGENVLFVDLENGIGAVQFYRGTLSRALLGEIGHTTVEKNGTPCFCGNRGCLEAMCSPQKLLFLYESVAGKKLSSLASLEKLYEEGDEAANFSVTECAGYLGIGLANLVNLLNPAQVVIHTGDFRDCPAVIQAAEKELRKRAFSSLTENLLVRCVTQPEKSTIIGMAYSLCDRLFDLNHPDNVVE